MPIEAIRLAEHLENFRSFPDDLAAAAELRRLHAEVQALRGARARLQIELRLVEQLLDDPDFETTASDMEYWGPLHDRLKAKLKEKNT